MPRALILATLFAVLPCAASAQTLSVLHVKVTLADASHPSIPIARHVLFISDNPATSSPRRVVTGRDGTVDVRLRAGSYTTVESDEPVAFNHARGYQWTRTVEIAAGRDAVLDLTAANAEVGGAPASSSSSPAPQDDDPSLLLVQWQESVVAIWTAESRASGFIIDAAGLVVTNQRVIGSATTVEVQLTPSIKVAARVLAADRGRDIAVLWIDPAAIASVRPVPLGCADGSRPPFAPGQRMVAIGAPLRGQTDVSLGDVLRVGTHEQRGRFQARCRHRW